MKVLVIGGCGFIGSHVVDALLRHDLDVRVYDRRHEAFREPLANVEYVLGDIADTTAIFEAMAGVTAVLHLASMTVPSTSNLDPVADITGNLIATVRLLEMIRASEVSRIVYLSSGGTVYGIPETVPVKETHPLRPISSYGIVKVAIESYMFMENQLHGLEHVVLRASNPYGPRQGHTGIQGIIGTHLWRIARKEPIEIWGDGSIVRDFIHVRDLAELCVRAALSDIIGCYNAGSGEGVSVRQIVEEIDRAVQADGGGAVAPVFKPGRAYDVPRIELDMARAEQAFSWTPQIGLSEGIAETWQWVKGQV